MLQRRTVCEPFMTSDLQRVGQTAAGVAGLTNGVQGLAGETGSAPHEEVDCPVFRHVGGHHEGGHTLGGGD